MLQIPYYSPGWGNFIVDFVQQISKQSPVTVLIPNQGGDLTQNVLLPCIFTEHIESKKLRLNRGVKYG